MPDYEDRPPRLQKTALIRIRCGEAEAPFW